MENKKRNADTVLWGKVPPQSPDMEESVLGACMIDKDALITIIDILKPEIFYDERNGLICEAILNLFRKTQPIDLLTVTEELRELGKLEEAGGAYYVTSLTNRVASAAHIEHHARIVMQKYISREIIRVSSEATREAYEDTTDVLELLQTTEKAIYDIASKKSKTAKNISAIISANMEKIKHMKANPDLIAGVHTGLEGLDRVTGGWQKTDLIIVAARPSMGKCLSGETEIVMIDGSLKQAKDIVYGDLLMGIDSKPRFVSSICKGQEMMYWVHQKKGISYRVNESHVLSLKRSHNGVNVKSGEILNIPVNEYLGRSEKFKKNFKGWKTGVEFNTAKVEIDPYLLGLWLGDGSCNKPNITNPDNEILEWIKEYCAENNLTCKARIPKGRCRDISITTKRGLKNPFIDFLRDKGIFEVKSIPNNFLINSTENRLKLLAGLIDSDGYNFGTGYEITQKSEKLSAQIKFLADSLGFRTTMKISKKGIKTTGFSGNYYRINIFGDCGKIPVLVERKKIIGKTSKYGGLTGVTVVKDKVDDYYGFALSGGDDKLFLLKDFTVTHNTAFVVTVAANAAIDFNVPVAVFSLEMSEEQIGNRILSLHSEVDQENIKRGYLTDTEMWKLGNSQKEISHAPIYIDDTPSLSVLELRAKARRMKMRYDIQLIVVDYLQLMTVGVKKGQSREGEVSEISRTLKAIAKELYIPVIALSQLSRKVEERGGSKKPMLSDLRESGAIEQDADIVVFLHRPEYYGIDVDENGESTQGVAELIIAKHRHGALENIKVSFQSRFTKFTNYKQVPTGLKPVKNYYEKEGKEEAPPPF